MASPQTGDGYTPIANELLEQVYKLKLNGTQFRIIMVVWRFTYGFSRKEHELSETFISKATEVNKKQVSRELNVLISFNVLQVVRQATFTDPRVIRFNKDYSEWELKYTQGANQLPPLVLANATGSGLEDSTGSGLDPQENNIKTNIKQDSFCFFDNQLIIEKEKKHKPKEKVKKEKETYTELFNRFWKAYPRKDGKVLAQKSFDKLKPNNEMLEFMLSAIDKQKQSKQWSDKQYIPYPATWLNQKRWEDEEDEKEVYVSPLKQTGPNTFSF